MIIINSNNNTQNKILTTYAIDGFINDKKNLTILLIDENNEFSSLIDKYNGKKIFCNHITHAYLEEFVEDTQRLYSIQLDSPIEYNLKEIRRVEIEIEKLGYEVVTILNTNDESLSEFIKKYYKKNLKDFYK